MHLVWCVRASCIFWWSYGSCKTDSCTTDSCTMPCTCMMCTCTTAVRKSTLRRVTPHGRARAIYKCNIECRFEDSDSKWPNDLGGQGQWLPCSIPADTDLLIKAEIYYKFLCGQARFPRILIKMTLKINVNDPHFQYQTRLSQDECLMQIWWFRHKSVMSYRADNPNFQ